jgi:hypothetical protein
MESCCGAGNRPITFREDGLISFPVERFIFTFDIGRQRNPAHFLKMVGNRDLAGESEFPSSILHLLHDPVKILSELDTGSRLHLF